MIITFQNTCDFKALRHFSLLTGQIHLNFWFSSPQQEEWAAVFLITQTGPEHIHLK